MTRNAGNQNKYKYAVVTSRSYLAKPPFSWQDSRVKQNVNLRKYALAQMIQW